MAGEKLRGVSADTDIKNAGMHTCLHQRERGLEMTGELEVSLMYKDNWSVGTVVICV